MGDYTEASYKERKKAGFVIGFILGAVVSGTLVYPLGGLKGRNIGYDKGRKEERIKSMKERAFDYNFNYERKKFEPGSQEEQNQNILKQVYQNGFVTDTSSFTNEEIERIANEGKKLDQILREYVYNGNPLPPEFEKYFK